MVPRTSPSAPWHASLVQLSLALLLGLSAGILGACSGAGGGDDGGGGGDGPPQASFSFGASGGTVTEGSGSLTVSVVLDLTGKLAEDVTVEVLDLENGTATAGDDYTTVGTRVLTFPASSGDGAVQSFSLTAAADSLVEGASETFELQLQNPSFGSLAGDTTYAGTVADSDVAYFSWYSPSRTTSTEQERDFSDEVQLRLFSGDTLAVDVSVTAVDKGTGTATSGVDYSTFDDVLVTFPAGTPDLTSQTITYHVLDDSIDETDETVVLGFESFSPGTLPGIYPTHTLTITDDDVSTGGGEYLLTAGANGTEDTLAPDDTLEFGTVTVGTATSSTLIRITNTGGGELAIGEPLLTGANADDFDLEVDSSSLEDLHSPSLGRGARVVDLASPLVAIAAAPAAPGEVPLPGQRFALDLARLSELRAEAKVRLHGFALEGVGDLTLELERQKLPLVPGAELRIDGAPAPGGIAAAVGDLTLWSGTALELPGSHVFLSLSDRGAQGKLELPLEQDGIVHVETELVPSPFPDQPPSRLVRVVREAELAARGLDRSRIPCSGEAVAPIPDEALAAMIGAGGGTVDTNSFSSTECRLALESDYQFFQLFGNTTDLTDYVTALIGAISGRYWADVQMSFTIAYLGIYTTAGDPWSSPDNGGSTADMLAEFRTAWNTNGWPASADLAHFLSGANLGGGRAYLPGLCNPSYQYGVSGNLEGFVDWDAWTGNAGSFTWDFVVIAHELGHNCGANHTHAYCPPLDHCYANCESTTTCTRGTIMSYCHTCGGMANIDPHFHQVIANIIRTYVGSSCLGRATLQSGDFVQYRATFAPLSTTGSKTSDLMLTHDGGNVVSPFYLTFHGTAD